MLDSQDICLVLALEQLSYYNNAEKRPLPITEGSHSGLVRPPAKRLP